MRTLVIGFALFGIFAAGGISGAFIGARFVHPITQQRAAEQFARQQFRRINEQLSLSNEQRERIRPLITETAAQIREHRREIFRLLDRMDGALRAELTEEQRVKYDRWRSLQRDDERRTQRALRELRGRRKDALEPPRGSDHSATDEPRPDPSDAPSAKLAN